MKQPCATNKYAPGSWQELLQIAFPLILSTSSISLMHIIDRKFLASYSTAALAASLAGGITSFTFLSVFLGTGGYVATFVAQYHGAGRSHRIGAALWQGLYFAMISTCIILYISTWSEPLFRFIGHPAEIQLLQIIYFRVLLLGAGGEVFVAVFSAFFSGRGKTWTVMWVNLVGFLTNVVLNYLLIFGIAGFPEWGIFGAGVATIIATGVKLLLYIGLVFRKHHDQHYEVFRSCRFDPDLFVRLLKYGFPQGLRIMIDVGGITLFVLFVGKLGEVELAATTIAFTINSMVFMPMLGMAVAISVLVGRYQGANQPDTSAKTTWNALVITMLYMCSFAVLIFSIPGTLIKIFHPPEMTAHFIEIAALTRHLLIFVAIYSLVDGCNIVFASALEGAGDTRFILFILLLVVGSVLGFPVGIGVLYFGQGIYYAWTFLALYVFILSGAFYLRFLTGKWRTMRVIEYAPNLHSAVSEGPVVEI